MVFRSQRKSGRLSLLVSLAAHGIAAVILSIVIVANREAILSTFTTAEMVTLPEAKPKIRMAPQRLLHPPTAPRISIQAPTTPANMPVTAASVPVLSSDTFTIPSGFTRIPNAGAGMIRPVTVTPTTKPTVTVSVPVIMPRFDVTLERTDFLNGGSPVSDLRPAVPSALNAFALSSNRDKPQDSLLEYQREVRERIARAQEYPRFARENGLEGKATVWFTLRRDGTLVEVKMLASAGSKALDDAAIGAIRGAAPFPPIPTTYKSDTLPFELDIVFNLRDRG